MGLGIHAVEAIAREHLNRPIDGDVLLIGRQTVYLSPQQLIHHLKELGVVSADAAPVEMEIDRETLDRKDSDHRELVMDRELFRLLGARSIRALDHSPYEGAEVIHDLRYPVPANMRGIADFIVDGSTLDNVFSSAMTLQNYSDLLRPGGRLVAVNAFSPHDTAYVIMPPMWYVDYFVMNGFADCKVYVVVFIEREDGIFDNVFYVDLDHLLKVGRSMSRIKSPYHMVTIVFAEKGPNTTTDRVPIQQDYRPDADWQLFTQNLGQMKRNRTHIARSHKPQQLFEPPGGHVFIDTMFSEVTTAFEPPSETQGRTDIMAAVAPVDKVATLNLALNDAIAELENLKRSRLLKFGRMMRRTLGLPTPY